MQAILALDQGTTSSRALLFGRGGEILAIAQREFRQVFPRPGWVEHDPSEIWSTQIEVAAEAIGKVKDVKVEAIGITNQRETTVVWDRATGRPVSNAIVWQDRRTAEFCDELEKRGHAELIRQRTGLVVDPYFSATKVRWILDHVAGARDAANAGRLAFGTIDSWLVWNLTRGRRHVTDATNASRTMLFDIHRGAWDDEILELLEVSRSLLPEVVASSGEVARTADGLPIPAGIPVAGIAGDQQAALFGQRCCRAGMAKNTYGTGSFVVMNIGERTAVSPHGLLCTIAWKLPDIPLQYAMEGSIFVTGAAVQWLRDGLGIIGSAPEIEALAASVADSEGVVFVPAFTGLGTPHWDAYARGTIAGITRGTTKAHLARAALESIALQTVDVLEAMRADGGVALEELRVDGGASRNDLLMQIQADLAGIPVVRAGVSEATALGAAGLAARAVGFWSDAEIDARWTADRVFEPSMKVETRAALLDRWHRGVEKARGWAMK